MRERIEAAAYETLASFVLPPSSWWDDYYAPMRGRIAELEARHRGEPIAEEIARESKKEIAMFERFSDTYSYAFFIVRPLR